MTLIKTSLLNAIAVSIKLITFLGINKLLAFYVGPAGYAILGQYQNALTLITTFASGAINTGVTKYTAEYYDDPLKQHRLWKNAGTIAFLGSFITAILIFYFNKALSILIFKTEIFASIFLWFALLLVFFVFNALLLAILNGKKEIGRYVVANIAGSILALFITFILVFKLNLYGALLGLAIYQSCAFFITIFICYYTPWFKIHYLFGKLDFFFVKNLFKYTSMAIVTAVCVPVSQILIRNSIAYNFGWVNAGYIEAMWRVSSAYLMLITMTLSVYYLPKLSELKSASLIKKEILNIYKLVLPSIITGAIVIYFLRNIIINFLFTKNFIAIESLFAWQLTGDTIKIASWVLSYLYIAKGFFRLYIFSELFFSLSFYLLCLLLENVFYLQSVFVAYVINYLIYFCFVFYSLKLKRII